MPTERRLKWKQINTLAGIASLVVIAFYVGSLGIGPERRVEAPRTSDNLAVDRVVSQFSVMKFDSDGHINHRLTADLAEFYSHKKPLHVNDHGQIDFDPDSPANQVSETTDKFVELSFSDGPSDDEGKASTVVKLASPVVKVYSGGNAVSELTSNEAYLEQQAEQAHFFGGVRIIDSVNDTILLSEKMLLDMRIKQVLSRESVNIVGPNISTTAQGLQGNLADQRWQLLSDVKSVLTP